MGQLENTFNQDREQYKFNTIVFDLGGVILHGGSASNNNSLASTVARAYGLENPTQEIVEAMDECVQKNQIGISSAQTQAELISKLGQPKDVLSIEQIYFNDAQELTIDQNMVRLIKYFQNEGIRIIFASNIVQDEWGSVEVKFKEEGLNIQLLKPQTDVPNSITEIEKQGLIPVFTSFSMGVRKGTKSAKNGNKTFFEVIKEAASLDPNTTLVIDDKAQYCQEAEDLGFHTYNFSTDINFAKDVINLETSQE